jgi:hypothetical protein
MFSIAAPVDRFITGYCFRRNKTYYINSRGKAEVRFAGFCVAKVKNKKLKGEDLKFDAAGLNKLDSFHLCSNGKQAIAVCTSSGSGAEGAAAGLMDGASPFHLVTNLSKVLVRHQ